MARRGENIRKRKDGRWEARVIIGYNEYGKAKYKYLYGKTYFEVKKKAVLISENKPQKTPETGKMAFGQLLNEWLLFIEPNLKESTFAKYLFNIRRHIEPVLGHLNIEEITCEVIDHFTHEKLEHGKLSGKGGLSPKTVSCLLSIIKLVIDYGVTHNYCFPANLVIHFPRQQPPDIQILNIQEQKKIEQYIFSHPDTMHIGIILSLYTGLRIGEVCALRWENINFESKLLVIEKTIMRIQDTFQTDDKKTKIIIDRPKTACSIRKIPLPEFLCTWLKKYQTDDSHYILTGTKHYIEPRNYYYKYKDIMSVCGLSKYNYHALRHTFATRCVENEFDIKSLSEILGHADVSITLRRYVHPSMELKRKHMEKLCQHSFCGQDWGISRPDSHEMCRF